MNIVGIIPARMASSRFPGKPLVKICGIPMLGHVYLRSKLSKSLKGVSIATCDRDIFDYALSIGAKPIMTASTHERASDRAAEAMLKFEKESAEKIDILVMIQGDEPLLYPEMIDQSIQPLLKDKSVQVVNLASLLKTRSDEQNPNIVKVSFDLNHNALYFSREEMPSHKMAKENKVAMYKQVPIISFRRDFLIKFNELPHTPLEIIESIDMLRVLEHGYKVRIQITDIDTYGVDVPKDKEQVERIMENDPYFLKYSKGDK